MIKIFSTYTKDTIFYKAAKSIKTKKGGPAFFIERVFKKHHFPYILKIGKTIAVEIKLTENKETGRVKEKIKSKKILLKNNKNRPILISTVGKEWILENNFNKEIKIFLDIQGYVRSLKYYGKKTFFKAPFLKNIFCLKGNKEEITHLPTTVIKRQKRKCLIVTRGAEGVTIYYKGKKFIFKPKKKIITTNMIGAGDTFFASFVTSFLKTKGDIIRSGNFAIKETEKFLSEK